MDRLGGAEVAGRGGGVLSSDLVAIASEGSTWLEGEEILEEVEGGVVVVVLVLDDGPMEMEPMNGVADRGSKGTTMGWW